jgi:outer membrane protein assembly factor BamD (BamD/ComL family)
MDFRIFRMHCFRRFAWMAALAALAAAGCQSGLGQNQTVRSQSPGLGGRSSMPKAPPKTGKDGSDDGTLFESISARVSSLWKPAPDTAKGRAKLQEAEQAFMNKDYETAQELYREAADLAPGSSVEEDAMLMIGECYFFTDKYPKAAAAYHALLKKHNNTRHMDRVVNRLFIVGRYWRDCNQDHRHYPLVPNLTDGTRPWYDTGGHALKAFEQVWLNDPTGPLAGESVIQTANTHFLNERWGDADQYYTQLRKDFPNSKHIVQAYILGYRAKLKAYQGPGYDATPLLQAEELITALLTQFKTMLTPEEMQLVQQAADEVYAQKAEREWSMAEFYRRNGNNRAAALYYQNLLKNYPKAGVFVQQATERLNEVANKPPTPAPRLVWLTRLFPEQREIPKPINPKDAEN